MKALLLVLAALSPETESVLDRLAPGIAEGIARKDTKHPVFHGNVDWHSAVHGHWALLRIARATGKHAGEAKAADASMTPEGIEAEAKILRENPAFEMPYGRAWFLRLAVEHDLWSGGKDPRLKGMAREVARSMLDHYAQFPPSPCSHDYLNASWALAQLHAWFRHAKDAQGLEAVQAIVRDRFLEIPIRLSLGTDASSPEFFSPLGNWAYLVATTQDAKVLQVFLDRQGIPDADLKPVEALHPYPHGLPEKPMPIPHQLGLNWSRAWALKALSKAAPGEKDRKRFEAAYRAHVDAAMKRHEAYGGDFWLYGHWVPQFAVYALTEGEEGP